MSLMLSLSAGMPPRLFGADPAGEASACRKLGERTVGELLGGAFVSAQEPITDDQIRGACAEKSPEERQWLAAAGFIRLLVRARRGEKVQKTPDQLETLFNGLIELFGEHPFLKDPRNVETLRRGYFERINLERSPSGAGAKKKEERRLPRGFAKKYPPIAAWLKEIGGAGALTEARWKELFSGGKPGVLGREILSGARNAARLKGFVGEMALIAKKPRLTAADQKRLEALFRKAAKSGGPWFLPVYNRIVDRYYSWYLRSGDQKKRLALMRKGGEVRLLRPADITGSRKKGAPPALPWIIKTLSERLFPASHGQFGDVASLPPAQKAFIRQWTKHGFGGRPLAILAGSAIKRRLSFRFRKWYRRTYDLCNRRARRKNAELCAQPDMQMGLSSVTNPMPPRSVAERIMKEEALLLFGSPGSARALTMAAALEKGRRQEAKAFADGAKEFGLMLIPIPGVGLATGLVFKGVVVTAKLGLRSARWAVKGGKHVAGKGGRLLPGVGRSLRVNRLNGGKSRIRSFYHNEARHLEGFPGHADGSKLRVGQKIKDEFGREVRVVSKGDDYVVLSHPSENGVVQHFFSSPRLPVHEYRFALPFGGEKLSFKVIVPALKNGRPDKRALAKLKRAVRRIPPQAFKGLDEIVVNPFGRKGKNWMADQGGRRINFYPSGMKPGKWTKYSPRVTDRWKYLTVTDTLRHELGHLVARMRNKGTVNPGSPSPGIRWRLAAHRDSNIVTQYGKTKIDEDFAEALMVYLKSDGGVRSPGLRAKFANRFEILDEIFRADPSLRNKLVRRLRLRGIFIGAAGVTVMQGGALYTLD